MLWLWWLLLLENFIQQSLNSASVQDQILLAVYQRSAMMRISDSGLNWEWVLTPIGPLTVVVVPKGVSLKVLSLKISS